MRLLYSLTIACSSFLLFVLQPVAAKTLLPRYGGSAGVWLASMLFFQLLLLAGYAYSYVISISLSRRAQSAAHAFLVIGSLATMTMQFRVWQASSPSLSILGTLLLSIGLPYFLLSATSPLLQSWLGGSSPAPFPWWLFALSNASSLAALLAYPVVIEPSLPQSSQLRLWWIGYGIFAVLLIAAAAAHMRSAKAEERRAPEYDPGSPLIRIALAACASALWMSVAKHLSQEVAPVPFLWVLPLSVYLLSFILCFEGRGRYQPKVFKILLPVAWIAAAYRLSNAGTGALVTEIAIFTAALFVWCMFCHGEIARTKPESGAPLFYLTIAAGGALGALLVGLIAPAVLTTYLELPIAIVASVVLALYLLYGVRAKARLIRLAVVAVAAFIVATRFQAGTGTIFRERNFYGALQVTDADAVRTLYNGKTRHGIEFLAADKLTLPTAYYGPHSGAGQILAARPAPGRIGLVGLGAGTLASYGRPGDTFRFYEINPAVIDVASHDFHFLEKSQAKIELIEGDGRLALEREPSASFDYLVLDAFSGDSIPVHLLTREAFQTYFRILRPEGEIAIHITNRFLDLAPVVRAVAASLGRQVIEVRSEADPAQQVLAADWMLVSARNMGETPSRRTKPWTDDYSNLFEVLK
ncbi:MAG TPA: fused MFS/spermidine synthase [Bryobacteraceae bacterium]|nr:fused MFS/spermidine synthase [Bryobacteraceae bacterium]